MTDDWQPPGPGSWMRDDVHFVGAMSGYLAALFLPAFAEGWRNGFERYGLPIEALHPAVVGGRMFVRVQPVGAPEPKDGKVASPPPKAVMRMLFAVHPELRRRRKTAKETVANKRWRADRARWETEKGPSFRARCLDLQAVDPVGLDDAQLRDHIAALEQLFHEGNVTHFAQMPASAIPVGDFLRRTAEWTGDEPANVAIALQGHCPVSAQTLESLAAVAKAVRAVPGLAAALADPTVAPDARLAQLRVSTPEAEAALDAYLGEHGNRIVTGFDVSDQTLNELAGIVVASVLSRIDPPSSLAASYAGDAAANSLRERVPAQHRAEFDELLVEARAGYALHDEDVGYTYMWPLGLIRRALLVGGERLATRGVLRQREDIFEASPSEVAALLAGDGAAPSSTDLARRAAERSRLSELEPPDFLGPEGALPDATIFPEPVGRITGAFLAYIADANLARSATANVEPGATGVAASPGVYEGRARVLSRPDEMGRVEVGDVLIASITSPAYNTVLPMLGAIVTDKGGALCHAAIVAREFGIPAVVGTMTATQCIPDGAKVRVDGDAGSVTVLG